MPQSVTVVTEKLIEDRNLDTLKEALRNTAGISFLAAEGGEEDIRLRGFSLQATGDIFIDGMRDPAFYERDTFNWDRLEVLRGSASMLFGRGSTGGAVNQVSKLPRLATGYDLELTVRLRRIPARALQTSTTGQETRRRCTSQRWRRSPTTTALRRQKGHRAHVSLGRGFRRRIRCQPLPPHNDNGINYGIPWYARATATLCAHRPDPLLRHGERLQRRRRHVRQHSLISSIRVRRTVA